MTCPCPKHPFGCFGHPNSCGCAKDKAEAATDLEAKDKEIEESRERVKCKDVEIAGAVERSRMLLDAKDHWKARAETAERVFTDILDELGCERDNEAALEAVAALKSQNARYRRALEIITGSADGLQALQAKAALDNIGADAARAVIEED